MKINPWARRQSRRVLVQALYQWQMGGAETGAVRKEFLESGSLKKADRDFFVEIFNGAAARVDRDGSGSVATAEQLDTLFAPLLDRKVSELDQVERAILRLGTFELAHRIDVPYRVVLDEYVELTKTFGAEDSHKYINAVLDALAQQLRSVEVNHDAASKQSR